MATEGRGRITITQTAAVFPESPFYIPMTGPFCTPAPHTQTRRYVRCAGRHGDIGASAGGPDGLLIPTRAIWRGWSCSQRHAAPAAWLQSAQRQFRSDGRSDQSGYLRWRPTGFRKDTIHIVRTIFSGAGTAYQRIAIHNHGEQTRASISPCCSTTISPICSRCAASGARAAASAPPNVRSRTVVCPTSVWMTLRGPRACISTRGRRD